MTTPQCLAVQQKKKKQHKTKSYTNESSGIKLLILEMEKEKNAFR